MTSPLLQNDKEPTGPAPGPWQTKGTAGHQTHGQWAVYGPDGRDIAIVYDGPANAPLIAAARELYDALKAVAQERAAAGMESGSALSLKIDAAIAKAHQP